MSLLSKVLLHKTNKKAYFFIIDAFIGSTIIFLSLLIIFNSHFNTPKIQTNYQFAEDYSTFIMNAKLEDLNNDYLNRVMIPNSYVHNMQNTIMDQITEFYYNAEYVCAEGPSGDSCRTANLSLATIFLQNVTDPLVPSKYGFSYIIKDSQKNINMTVYNRSMEKLPASNVVIASKKITYLQLNSSTLFGPQITEIKIWI